MYAILMWLTDDYVTFLHNENGSIKLFNSLSEADKYADNSEDNNDMRVICIEGVK